MIDAEKANYKIAWMCRLLGVPRSSFYAWRNRAETATAARRRELAGHVRRVFEAGRGAYGCRRVAAQLNREGHPCSVGLVADLMRELGLRACQPRAYKRTTVPGEQPVTSPDLIGRDFTAAAPGQRLVGDITYLRTGEGWLYLATVIDLATRMVVGWQLAEPHAHQPGHRRPGHGHQPRPRPARRGLPHRPRLPIHLGRVRPVLPGQRASAPASAGPACAGTTPPPRASSRALKNEMYHRQAFPDPGPSPVRRRRLHRGVLQPATGCTPPSATAPPPKHSPNTRPQQPLHDQQPEELSKILDTAQ